jgi:hypothetical protein
LTLPWVSREAYNRVLADLEYERARGDRLMILVTSMAKLRRAKRKEEAPSQEPVVAAAPVIPVEVQWPIEQRAGGDPFLRRHLNVYAQGQLAKGTTPEEIIHRIRNGDDDDEG